MSMIMTMINAFEIAEVIIVHYKMIREKGLTKIT